MTKIKNIFNYFFTLYCCLIFMIILIIATPTILLSPRKMACILTKFYCFSFLTLCGWRPHRTAFENITSSRAQIFIANHASYLDGLLMVASLPANVKTVSKKETLNMPFIGRIIRKLGHFTLDRHNPHQSKHDLEKIKAALIEGESILIFPEGTFKGSNGIRAFKSGAFKLAVDTGTPLQPIAIKGTRSIWKEGQWYLKPSYIELNALPLLVVETSDKEEIVRLRTLAREMLHHSTGEPLLNFYRGK